MENDRYYVMGQMVEAVALLAASGKMHTLLPEIRSNLVMALRDAVGRARQSPEFIRASAESKACLSVGS